MECPRRSAQLARPSTLLLTSSVVEGMLGATRERGYRHLEGVAERLLGESLVAEDRAAAKEHLGAATRILEEVGARNELAKTWMAQATLRRAEGDEAGALTLARRALALFEELGTLDEPGRVRAWLASAPARG